MQRKFTDSFYNLLSILGAGLALLSFGVIILLILLEQFSVASTPYIGIVTYIILPVFLILGLLVIPIGMVREHARRLRGLKAATLPRLDLNDSKHRRTTIFFAGATAILAIFTSFGTYQAFEFTESVTFCGQTCHVVMEPEFVAYQTSAHARVKCVDCHVGSGAEWFVRSKLSGAYQLFAVATNSYHRPIATPIQNLRPARETCEQCHWPDKFYGKKQSQRIHYLNNESNTRWRYNLLQIIGGAAPLAGGSDGIHWHIDNKVEYYALDKQKQEIPWVRVTGADGKSIVYTTEGTPETVPDSVMVRTMDCMDCHNRPSHVFSPPQLALNQAIETGHIPATLPYIKSKAVEALEAAESDTTREDGLATIKSTLQEYYESEYADGEEASQENVAQAIAGVQLVYRQNFFPHMKASWRVYPNNIGHLTAPGCYRCHDGQHTSSAGLEISDDCNHCHLIIEQEDGGDLAESNLAGLEFKHPEDIDGEWRETGCYECHGAE